LKNHLTPGCSDGPVCEEIVCEDIFVVDASGIVGSVSVVGVTGPNKKTLV
jgi:hypothetical protein